MQGAVTCATVAVVDVELGVCCGRGLSERDLVSSLCCEYAVVAFGPPCNNCLALQWLGGRLFAWCGRVGTVISVMASGCC